MQRTICFATLISKTASPAVIGPDIKYQLFLVIHWHRRPFVLEFRSRHPGTQRERMVLPEFEHTSLVDEVVLAWSWLLGELSRGSFECDQITF